MLETCKKEVDTSCTIHLPFQHLQPVDLAFSLAVGPRLAKRRRNGVEIGREPARKGRQSRRLRLIQPVSQPVLLAVADHGGEGIEEPTVLRQLRQSVLDLRDEYAVGLREMVPTRGHHAGNLAARRTLA